MTSARQRPSLVTLDTQELDTQRSRWRQPLLHDEHHQMVACRSVAAHSAPLIAATSGRVRGTRDGARSSAGHRLVCRMS